MSSKIKFPLFQTSIEVIFSSWTALKLAVENGQGGGYGKDIATWMMAAVEDYFYQNDDLMGVEVAEFIGTLMDQELDTVVDDNSLEEIGNQLCLYFRMCVDKKDNELREILEKLNAAAKSVKASSVPLHQTNSDSEESSSEEMETEDSTETHPNGHSSTNEQLNSSNATAAEGSHRRVAGRHVTAPDEDGWVTVKKSNR